MGLMGSDGFHDLCNFCRREATPGQRCRGLLHGIDDIVPAGECLRVFGPMSNEHPQVMEPCGGVDHIVIVGHPLAYQLRQRI